MPSAHFYIYDRALIDSLKLYDQSYTEILLMAPDRELTARAFDRLWARGIIQKTADGRFTLGWDLSPREWQVLDLAAVGMGHKEVGRLLGIARSTVKHHCANIIAKINPASDIAGIVPRGIAEGYIDVEKAYKAVLLRRSKDRTPVVAHFRGRTVKI